MYYLIGYGLIWIFAILFLILRSIQNGEISFKSKALKKVPKKLVIAIKACPALLAAILMISTRPTPTLFYSLMAMAFVLCMLGDIGIEFNILIGLGLFLIAHLIFSAAFIWQSLSLDGTFSSLTGFILVFIANAIYLIFLLEYLQSSKGGLGKFKIPVIIYAIMIAFMLSSSVLLWLTTGLVTGIVVTLGAVFFVISDSLISIREWHHSITKSTIKIEGTYYIAIFLLSLSVIIYLF